MPKSPADKVATKIPVIKTARSPNLRKDMIYRNAENKSFPTTQYLLTISGTKKEVRKSPIKKMPSTEK